MRVMTGLVGSASPKTMRRPMMLVSIPAPLISLPISSTIRMSSLPKGMRGMISLARTNSARSVFSNCWGQAATTSAVSS